MVELTATDSGSLSMDKNITVVVKNINEAPTKVVLSSNEVFEKCQLLMMGEWIQVCLLGGWVN